MSEICSLKAWLETAIGRHVRALEQRQINHLVSNVFGYHAVQVNLPDWNLLRTSRIMHKWYTQPQVNPSMVKTNLLVAQPEALPFETQSIDLILLPHVLENAYDPHQVLREVERVLVPEGQVIITGFNPFSLWGLRERLLGFAPRLPAPISHWVSPYRVGDWLELLSFDMEDSFLGGYIPYCEQRRWIRRWQFMEYMGRRWWPIGGAVYVVRAVKRVSGMRMVGLDWSKAKPNRRARTVAANQNYPRSYPSNYPPQADNDGTAARVAKQKSRLPQER